MGIEEQIIELVEKRGVAKGIKEGSEKSKRQIVRHLRVNLGFTDKQTAEMAQVSLKFVREVCNQNNLILESRH